MPAHPSAGCRPPLGNEGSREGKARHPLSGADSGNSQSLLPRTGSRPAAYEISRQPLFAPPAYSSVARTPKPGAHDHTCKSTSDLQIAQSPSHNTSYHSLSAPSRRTAKTRLGHDETRTITPTTYRPFATERSFTETRLAPQLDPGTNVVRIATLRMPAILVHRRPA